MMAEGDTESVDLPHEGIGVPGFLAPGTVIANRYGIERVAGMGGYATVYVAFDRELRTEIALKLLRADRASDTALERFRSEVAISHRAKSPRLVRVFDIGRSAEGTYVTMELIGGGTLREAIARGPMPVADAIALALDIATALADLHALGIVHRDVKPSNLLLTHDRRVSLADFGLALDSERDIRLTASSAVLGTVGYLSPEQALGHDVDARADLYSFGVVLFEMLTGRLPFESNSSVGTVVAHVQRRAPEVRSLRRDVPRWLARLVALLLEKSPEKRFRSAAEVAAALRAGHLPLRRAVPWARLAALVTAAAIVTGGAAYLRSSAAVSPRPSFGGIVRDGDSAIDAVDARGTVLWTAPVTLTHSAVLRRGGKPSYAATLRDLGRHEDLARNHQLELRDLTSGKVVRVIPLPDLANLFPRFSPTFHVVDVVAVDVAGDGNDALVVTYVHTPYWPSYAVYYDPVRNSVRPVFVASGQHRFAGLADVNGDGRKELLFIGINNLMGWYTGVAAVAIGKVDGPPASTPDTQYVSRSDSPLVWYALLPYHHALVIEGVDESRRAMSIRFADDSVTAIDFDGFIPDGHPHASSPLRAAHRREAYRALRESKRLAGGQFYTEALQFAARAQGEAVAADDALLAEWAARAHAAVMIRSGLFDEGEREFETLLRTSAARSEVAYDAAFALHLSREYDRAARWYRLGLGLGSNVDSGRGKYEYVEGEALALTSLGRWKDAEDAVQRYRAEYPQMGDADPIDRYLRWRRGREVSAPTLSYGSPDEMHYWRLEILNSAGADPRALLQEIAEQKKRSSQIPLLLSVESAVLERLGRHAEALHAAQQAYDDAHAAEDSDVVEAATLPLLEKRLGELRRVR